jgi:hypothetical protein
MAEEVHGTVQGPNGERLQLQVGTKSVGLSARDLTPILLLIAVIVGGYMEHQSNLTEMERLYSRQTETLALLHENQKLVQDVLTASRQRVDVVVQEQQAELRHHLEMLRAFFITHDWNQGREPAARLPLGTPPPEEHK